MVPSVLAELWLVLQKEAGLENTNNNDANNNNNHDGANNNDDNGN